MMGAGCDSSTRSGGMNLARPFKAGVVQTAFVASRQRPVTAESVVADATTRFIRLSSRP
jgi:hypothetical protein